MERCRRCGLWSPSKNFCVFCGTDGYAVPMLSKQATFRCACSHSLQDEQVN